MCALRISLHPLIHFSVVRSLPLDCKRARKIRVSTRSLANGRQVSCERIGQLVSIRVTTSCLFVCVCADNLLCHLLLMNWYALLPFIATHITHTHKHIQNVNCFVAGPTDGKISRIKLTQNERGEATLAAQVFSYFFFFRICCWCHHCACLSFTLFSTSSS